MAKKVQKKNTETARAKNMFLLAERYAALVYEPGVWLLPYVWNVFYIKVFALKVFDQQMDTCGEMMETEFVCNTNDIAFAAMIFKAEMLPDKVQVIGMNIAGIEKELENIILHEDNHSAPR